MEEYGKGEAGTEISVERDLSWRFGFPGGFGP